MLAELRRDVDGTGALLLERQLMKLEQEFASRQLDTATPR